MENKFAICAYLTDALRETREFGDNLRSLTFEPGETRDDREDHVIATALNGRKVSINVHADSGIAMIRDILRGIGGL